MRANEFIKWLNQYKVASVHGTEGLQNIYIIWDGAIQGMIENSGEYWEVERFDKLNSLRGELDDLGGDIEQCCLNAYDRGIEEGYEARSKETEKKLAE